MQEPPVILSLPKHEEAKEIQAIYIVERLDPFTYAENCLLKTNLLRAELRQI